MSSVSLVFSGARRLAVNAGVQLGRAMSAWQGMRHRLAMASVFVELWVTNGRGHNRP